MGLCMIRGWATAQGHSNLWFGAAWAASQREGRCLAPRACQLVHQLQLPLQGALDQQGYGVKQLFVLGASAREGSQSPVVSEGVSDGKCDGKE